MEEEADNWLDTCDFWEGTVATGDILRRRQTTVEEEGGGRGLVTGEMLGLFGENADNWKDNRGRGYRKILV